MSNDDSGSQAITFTGLPPGGWFGEGTLLKREAYRYNVQALRRSVVAGLPIEMFHTLLETSIGFNHFILKQLNERLGQFIAAREIDRTQQELADLVGLSRQRVNQALHHLAALGLIRIEYGGLRVLDLSRLQRFKPV